ncbi:MAG: hypothetical protein ACREQ9_17540, partial [Candidatus Binatia bacterium]
LLYFSLIGTGFMMVQIPYMQRFSVYLGHPTYSIAIILFSMILFTGAGSFVSDRAAMERSAAWLALVPLGAASMILLVTLGIQPIIDSTIRLPFAARSAVVVALTGAVSFLLGFCFPFGMRLVRPLSEGAMPWMWGVNGACSVLASVLAVAISLWSGIHTSLWLAAFCYAALPLPAGLLWRAGRVR